MEKKSLIQRKFKYKLLEDGFSKEDINSGVKVLLSRQITMASQAKKFEEELEIRQDKGKKYYNLRACKYYSEFELPKIIFFLSRIGVVTPTSLIKYRKYALLIVLTFAAIITPPDIASQIIVAIPVMILYQISIFISKLVLKKQNK